MRHWIAASLCAAILLASPVSWSAGPHVVFINPGRPDEPFWRSVERFMRPAAQQFAMQLEVLYAERDQLKMIDLTKQIGARRKKPDYLMIVNEKLAGGEMLKLADKSGIKTLVVFSKFDNAQTAELGRPRQKFRHWLGSLTPNAVDAGRLTADELVRQAQLQQAVAEDGLVHVALISGDKTTPTGTERLQGALEVLSTHPSVVLEQVVFGNWDRARAKEQASALLLRYPNLNAVWAASDLMAYGAMEAAEEAGRRPGVDMMFSAINNSPEVVRARLQGRISALAGGHFTAGAWGLVMLYDYHHGKDFKHEGLELKVPLFLLFDEHRAQRFLSRFDNEDYSTIDFRQFSKHLQPGLRRYQFSLLPVLK